MADSPQTGSPAAPAAGGAPAPKDLAAQTAALAKEIAAEAAAGGEWDPSTDPLLAGEPEPGAKPAKGPQTSQEPAGDDGEADDDSEDDEDSEAQEAPARAAPDGIPADVIALIAARDLDGLATRLGIPEEEAAEFFKIKADDFKAIRHDRKKLGEASKALEKLETQLREKYTDPVQARRAWEAGDIGAYFAILERWSGVPHAEVQKAWALHVQGRPVQLPKPAAPAAASAPTDAARAGEIAKLKERITADIAGDKLSAVPGITDLVFEKMREKWNSGVRTPAAALKLVAEDLKAKAQRDRKLLRAVGVLPKAKAKAGHGSSKGLGHSPPAARAVTAQGGDPNNTRKMSDKELAQDVLRGLGKEAWRQ